MKLRWRRVRNQGGGEERRHYKSTGNIDKDGRKEQGRSIAVKEGKEGREGERDPPSGVQHAASMILRGRESKGKEGKQRRGEGMGGGRRQRGSAGASDEGWNEIHGRQGS